MEKDETRAFFAARATTWDDTFPDDGPAFAAAIARLELTPGSVVVDAGCGTGRAMPLLREYTDSGRGRRPDAGDGAGRAGAWCRGGRRRRGAAVRRRDRRRHPGRRADRPSRRAPGTLQEFARVARPGARLALFHPVGRAALAARRGREPPRTTSGSRPTSSRCSDRRAGSRCTSTTKTIITWRWHVSLERSCREAPMVWRLRYSSGRGAERWLAPDTARAEAVAGWAGFEALCRPNTHRR